jgi:prepilin-type N-terminal cleavage/methylation domain-containing protein
MTMRRRGMTLLELVVAAALLGTVMVVCLQMLAATTHQRKIAAQRHMALLEVENAMERLAARPWKELPAHLPPVQLSPSVRGRLQDAELKVEVITSATEPLAKRIAVSLRWKDDSGQFTKPVTIVTWRWKERNVDD